MWVASYTFSMCGLQLIIASTDYPTSTGVWMHQQTYLLISRFPDIFLYTHRGLMSAIYIFVHCAFTFEYQSFGVPDSRALCVPGIRAASCKLEYLIIMLWSTSFVQLGVPGIIDENYQDFKATKNHPEPLCMWNTLQTFKRFFGNHEVKS